MKFKTIFILFNAVIAVSFLFVFLVPLFLLGSGYSLAFWARNGPLGFFFVAVFVTLNAFFAANRVIFALVEREDWDGLSAWLADRIFEKKRYRAMHVRFLISTALNKSDLAMIDRLEAELREHRPALLCKNAVLFGVVYLLRNDPAAAERFFSSVVGAGDADNPGWLDFDYGFSLVLQRREGEAVSWFRKAAARRDAVLVLLSSYMLGTLCAASAPQGPERSELEAFAGQRRDALRKRFGPERWSREIERARGEVHIVILTKLIDEASRWMNESGSNPAASPA
ncbi:MAG: hypothetical protein NT080_10155 [Spirochaetes bacterium]|nr:hypothetical protein [Spirochaetota bacterium]